MRALERLARWLKPPRLLRPTRAGWSFFVITFAVGFAALNTGNNLLYLVLSLMLSFLVLSGVLSESALRGIRLRRGLPGEIFANTDNGVFLEIHNAQHRVPSFAIVVEDRVESAEPPPHRRRATLETAGAVFALHVGPGETETRRYALRPARRGSLEFREFRVSTRFPFGLFRKSRTIAADAQALVFPALGSRVEPSVSRPRNAEGESPVDGPGDGSLVSGLREFRHGDSLRRVHWKSSLRRSQLVVREVENEQDSQVELRLRTHGIPADEQFEECVRSVASQAVAHLVDGHQVALRTDAEHLAAASGLHQRRRLLSFLAIVEPDGAGETQEGASS